MPVTMTASRSSDRPDVAITVSPATTLKTRPFPYVAHHVRARGQAPDEEERDREQQPVHRLHADQQAEHRDAGDHRHDRADRDQDGDDPDEHRRLARRTGDALLEAERLGDHVGRGDREDRGGEQARAEQPDRKQDLGEAAGERLQRLRRFGSRIHLVVAVQVQGRGGGDDDEARDHVREDRAGDDFGALAVQVVRTEAAFDDRRLEVELHERRDRRPGGRDEQDEERRGGLHLRDDDGVPDLAPVRTREDRGDRIGEERDRHEHEDPLRELVGAADEQQPDRDGADRHGHVRRDARQPERSADAHELRDADTEVRDEHAGRREQRPADAVLLANQICEALAGDHPHPRGHLLHDDEGERDHDHHPEQCEAVAGADGRVRRDPPGVVAGVCGDQARAEDGENGEQPAARAPQHPKRGRDAPHVIRHPG